MAQSTVYDIRLRYLLEDKATKGLSGMNRQLEKTAKSSGFLAGGFKTMMALGAGGFGMRHAAKSLIGFNSEMEQSKIQIQGMLALGGKMDSAMASSKATALFADLQQKAKASAGTTKDMVDMASMIARPVLAAGLGMKDLGDFTQQAVVASKAFGMQADTAARDIESALMGRIGSMDRFSRSILEPLGYVGEEGRKAFSELGAAARAAKIKEALSSPAIMEMARQQETSFDGVLSTFQDGLQMALGRVGKPLFAELTKEISTWSEWMDKNKKTLDSMGKSVGSGLVKGFRAVKSVLSFMVDHKDILLMIAKTWAAVKVGGKLGSMANQLGGMVGGGMKKAGGLGMSLGMDKFGLNLGKAGSKVISLASGFAKMLPWVGAAAMAFQGIWSWWKSRKSDEEKQRARDKANANKTVEKYDFSKTTDADAKGGIRGDAAGRLDELQFHVDAAKRSGDALSARGTMLAASLEGQQSEMAGLYQAAAGLALESGIIGEKGLPTTNNINSIKQSVGAELKRMGVAPEFARPGSDQNSTVTKAIVELGSNLGSTMEERESNFRKALAGTWTPEALATALQMMQTANGPKADDSNSSKPKINVTINRIEVASDDPDRFVFQLSETVKKLSRSPAQAAGAQKLGG